MTNILFSMSPLQMKFLMLLSKSFNNEIGQVYKDKLCISIPWINEITSCTLPAIESKEAF